MEAIKCHNSQHYLIFRTRREWRWSYYPSIFKRLGRSLVHLQAGSCQTQKLTPLSEFYSGPTTDKDYYDGLLDISHAAEWVTISNTYFHDHWKADLIGHSDNNAAEDTGHFHVTEVGNYW